MNIQTQHHQGERLGVVDQTKYSKSSESAFRRKGILTIRCFISRNSSSGIYFYHHHAKHRWRHANTRPLKSVPVPHG